MFANAQVRRANGWLLVGAVLLLLLLPLATSLAVLLGWSLTQPGHPATPTAPPALANVPLSFVADAWNPGPGSRYVAHLPDGVLSFEREGVALRLPITGNGAGAEARGQLELGISFVGASGEATLIGDQVQPGSVNYFIGSDPSRWRSGLQSYAALTYRGLYPGIDLIYEGGVMEARDGRPLLKGTYTVSPGRDPSLIAWRYPGAESVSLDAQGNLLIVVEGAEGRGNEVVLSELAPIAWQEINGRRILVDAHYTLREGGPVGFTLGAYDRERPLVIDPVLTYSTYLGGNFAEAGNGIAVDPMGNFYVTGYTNSTNFPTVNAIQNSYGGGGTDAFIAKFDPQGQPVYITYLGGSRSDDGEGIATDADGNAYVTGFTSSLNFPIVNAFQPVYGGGFQDVYITKLNPNGSAIIFSTYLGGSAIEEGGGISLDSARNIYVTGSTSSVDFPVRNPIQPTRGENGFDLFVTKLNPAASDLVWSTYLGGSTSDRGTSIAVDATGNTFVAGSSHSSDYPVVNAFQPNLRGTQDAVLSKINATGSALVFSTYLGGGLSDIGGGVDVDGMGNPYIAGYTDSSTFPTVNAYQPFLRGLSDAFVTKFNPTGTPLYSTYFGGEWLDSAGDIAVNSAGEAFIVGSTQSDELPLADPIYSQLRGTEDAFITRFTAAGNGLVFSTYFGGSNNREMQSGAGTIAVDAANTIYFAGDTGATDFPTYNPYQPFPGSAVDAFVSRISEQGPIPTPTAVGTTLPTTTVEPTATIAPTQTPGGPTATTEPTSTPMPTSTPCTIMFTDVPTDHTFYEFIRCLACHNIISGYADGTFKPENNITRGQISKMVSNAAGFNEPVSGQTFEDVPTSNTFYEWIERLASRGVMSGYPCGGVGEPCGPGSRPYFRWQLDATRGQLSKIVSEAAGFNEPIPPGQQTFTDVPTDNPFWVFIERLADRGVITGYPCGGAGEPCDDEERPYFRWGYNVTRGQASKIVAESFYPGCVTPRKQFWILDFRLVTRLRLQSKI